MEWISVKDRLPEVEKEDDYLRSEIVIVLIDSKVPLTAMYNKNIDGANYEFEYWYCPSYEDVLENVTHWQAIGILPK